MAKLVQPLDIVNEDYLTNSKLHSQRAYLDKEIIYVNEADLYLAVLTNLLYKRSSRIMRFRKNRNKSRKLRDIIHFLEGHPMWGEE